MRKPRPVLPGATIGVIAPASAPRAPEHLEAGLDQLRELGFNVVTGRTRYDPFGYLAGSDEERLAELNAMLVREDVDAIFCVRGGFGTLRLLSGIDFEAAARDPKLLVGYSDITALHLARYRMTGTPGLAGAMVASDFGDPDPASMRRFWAMMSGEAPVTLDGPEGEPLVPVRPGSAEGVLLGGNLTLVTRLIGTPYLPDFRGAILFFEEIGEEPYRLDGLLAQLKLSGILDSVAGVVVGAITDWEPRHDRPTLSLEDVLDHYLGPLRCPVARGLLFGHIREKVAVPVGVRARLEVDADAARLTVLEPVVLS